MKQIWLIVLLALPFIITTLNSDSKYMAFADDETDDGQVEVDVEGTDAEETNSEYSDSDDQFKTSPDADTYLLFTKPSHIVGSPLDIPAGHLVEFLVGFANKGMDDFIVSSVEASFRYPMDFNYYIQNFSAIPYNREVKPGHEATVSYSFLPSDTFAGRPFGLNILLNYRDVSGIQYAESVFNETVQIIEIEEGIDAETFFLYIFMGAVIILLLVVGQQYLVGSVGKRKRTNVTRKTIETGTTKSTDIDYDWLPQETLKSLQQSPGAGGGKKSPKTPTSGKISAKQSPKQPTQSPKQKKAI